MEGVAEVGGVGEGPVGAANDGLGVGRIGEEEVGACLACMAA